MYYIMDFKSLQWHSIDLIWSLRKLNEFVISLLYYDCQEFYYFCVTFGQFVIVGYGDTSNYSKYIGNRE